MGLRFLTYERPNFGANFGQFGGRYHPFPLGPPFAPIEALDLICQNRAQTRATKDHLEGIILDLRRHRAADHEARLGVCRLQGSEQLRADAQPVHVQAAGRS